MSGHSKIELEILTGPLDGHIISLESETEWTRKVGSLLSFPWDEELGDPQANFVPDTGDGWGLILHKSSHNTYRVNNGEKLEDMILLKAGDILRASQTWMLIKK